MSNVRSCILPTTFFLTAIGLISSCQSYEGHSDQVGPRENARPDVLFIAIDDLNTWAGVSGTQSRSNTPNLDALAQRGMRFTNAHAPASACMPSRTAILTGVSPFNSGHYTQVGDWRDNPRLEGVTTLPRLFRNHGYETRGAGKLFHAHTYILRGFQGQQDKTAWDAYFPSLERQLPDEVFPAASDTEADAVGGGISTGHFDFAPTVTTDAGMGDGQVVDWVIQQIAGEAEGPRFYSAGLYRPHLPWYVPQKYFDLHPLEGIELPPYLAGDLEDVPAAFAELIGAEPDLDRDTMAWVQSQGESKWREAIQGYLASVSFADAMVGKLIRALDKSGRAANTIIVLWADHGFHLGQKDLWGKMTFWDETTNVPLIVVAPGITSPGSSSDQVVSTQSIYATLAELAGLELPHAVDGASLMPLLREPDRSWDDVAITTYGEYGNFSVRDDKHRYTIYADGSEEFYDLNSDPFERTNLAGDQRYQGLKQSLASRIPPAATHAPAIVELDESE